MNKLKEILLDECPRLKELCDRMGIIPDPDIPIKINPNVYLFYATNNQIRERWLYITGGDHYIERQRILSDLHLEFDGDEYDPGEGHVLILAGDICNAVDIHLNNDAGKRYLNFFKRAASQYDKVFYTYGNHESYEFDLYQTDVVLRHRIDDRISILNNAREYYKGWWYVGSTLWADFDNENPLVMGECGKGMNDYHQITINDQALTPYDTLKLHRESVAYLKDILPQCKENTILFTHHAPSMQSVKDLHRVSGVEGAYATDLEYLLVDNPQVRFAFHGHTHRTENYKVGGCSVISNPRGYVNYNENPHYLKALCFDPDIYSVTVDKLAQDPLQVA